MKQKYDIITIGAGLGTLTAAALLAKKGYKVAMVEQHNIPGGMATTFKRKNLTVEVGLHELDGLDEYDMKIKILDFLGIRKKLTFIRLPEFYRFIHGETDITIPDSDTEAEKILTGKFPEEKKGIQKYFNTIRDLRKEISSLPMEPWKMIFLLPVFPLLFPNLVKQMKNTLGNFLDKHIQSEELKLVLIANLGYYHDDPYSMSMIYYSAAQSGFYYGGGHYIQGGSQNLSNALADVVTSNHGKIIYNRMVQEIIIENDKAVGIKYSKKNGELEEILRADKIIAGASLPNIVYKLLPKEFSLKLAPLVENKQNSCSIMTMYLGLNQPLQKLIKKNQTATYSTFFFPNHLHSVKEWHKIAQGDLNERGIVTVDYSLIDSKLTAKGKHFAVVCAYDYGKDWDKDESKYKKQKKEAEEKLLKKLEEQYPGIRKKIFYYELGTARTIENYTLNPGGSIYGFAQIPSQSGPFRANAKSKIPGLYMASAWVNPGGGFTGAMMSGFLAARSIAGNILKK